MIILQSGGVGGSNLLFAGVIGIILAVGLGYWVYKDATGRGRDKALLWALGVGFLSLFTIIGGLFAFGVYLYTRE